jgi:hypothetical protein
VQEIEGKEHESVRRRIDGRAERIEVGDAVLALDDDLTVNQRRLARQRGGGVDNPVIRSGPIPTGAGIGPDLALVDDDQGAITVILDLVDPPLPVRARVQGPGSGFRA